MTVVYYYYYSYGCWISPVMTSEVPNTNDEFFFDNSCSVTRWWVFFPRKKKRNGWDVLWTLVVSCCGHPYFIVSTYYIEYFNVVESDDACRLIVFVNSQPLSLRQRSVAVRSLPSSLACKLQGAVVESELRWRLHFFLFTITMK